MNVEERSSAKVEALRREVQRNGSVTLQPQELATFCEENMSSAEQFSCIAALARAENWSFAFRADGAVQFSSYE